MLPLPDLNSATNPFIDYWTGNVWPQLAPIFTVLNVLGLLVVCGLFWYYWHVRGQLAALEKEQKERIEANFKWIETLPPTNPRWDNIEKLAKSTNANDWRVALLECDSVLDEIIQKMGYPGETMGERMQAIPAGGFPFLQEAWRVHRLRNILAHETTYDLKKAEFESALDVYSLIFKQTGFIA